MVGALVGLDEGETDGDVEGLDVGLLVGEAVQPPLEVGDPSLHALVAARLCVFFAISGASLSLFALPSTLSFLALPNRRSFRCVKESRIYKYTGECMLNMRTLHHIEMHKMCAFLLTLRFPTPNGTVFSSLPLRF